MRRFLLWMGTMWVGMATLVVAVAMFSGDSGAFGAGLIFWFFALVVGVVLSAWAFLDPPEDGGGLWAFRLPLPLFLFLMMLKLTSWVGFQVLLGTWMLIFKVWHNRRGQLPTFGNGPQSAQQPQYGAQPPFGTYPPYGTQPMYSGPPLPGGQPQFGALPPQFAPPPAGPARPGMPQPVHLSQRTSTAPASWQKDPTGRFAQRWWDGTRWTEHVVNGAVQAVDPI